VLINIARGKLVVERTWSMPCSAASSPGPAWMCSSMNPTCRRPLRMDQVVLQAHRASATVESRTAMGEMVLASLAQGLAGQRPEGSLTT
jgi:lactate dehydrogenase-like 2-hydroxyacid dehydrogenase